MFASLIKFSDSLPPKQRLLRKRRISKADQKVIFDKYERASAAKRTFKKNGAPGFGLGLTYVFQVIDAHEGMIGVESELGKYTEFSIFLPDQKTSSGEAVRKFN